MKKLELKSRKILRTLFGCFSFTAIAFIFQACYGMENDCSYDVRLSGRVTSKATNLPIQGIKIHVHNDFAYGITDQNGNFSFYASVPTGDCINLRDSSINQKIKSHEALIYIRDIDSTINGNFTDTTFIVNPAQKDELIINIELIEKQ